MFPFLFWTFLFDFKNVFKKVALYIALCVSVLLLSKGLEKSNV